MCKTGLCKKEEKKSALGNVLVIAAAVIGIGTVIYIVAKYLFSKYHESCCALCDDDYDYDYDCDCDDCDFDCCDCDDCNDETFENVKKDESTDVEE